MCGRRVGVDVEDGEVILGDFCGLFLPFDRGLLGAERYMGIERFGEIWLGLI